MNPDVALLAESLCTKRLRRIWIRPSRDTPVTKATWCAVVVFFFYQPYYTPSLCRSRPSIFFLLFFTFSLKRAGDTGWEVSWREKKKQLKHHSQQRKMTNQKKNGTERLISLFDTCGRPGLHINVLCFSFFSHNFFQTKLNSHTPPKLKLNKFNW